MPFYTPRTIFSITFPGRGCTKRSAVSCPTHSPSTQKSEQTKKSTFTTKNGGQDNIKCLHLFLILTPQENILKQMFLLDLLLPLHTFKSFFALLSDTTLTSGESIWALAFLVSSLQMLQLCALPVKPDLALK